VDVLPVSIYFYQSNVAESLLIHIDINEFSRPQSTPIFPGNAIKFPQCQGVEAAVTQQLVVTNLTQDVNTGIEALYGLETDL
jgi:hypothetical protein